VCSMGREAQSLGLWGHQTWHLLPFSCGIRAMSNVPYMGVLGKWPTLMKSLDHCSCWNSNCRDAEACMGWYQLSARHMLCYKRSAHGNEESTWRKQQMNK
jgi:hypothetical protein